MAPPHFVLLPFLAPGHLIPMVDVARLLAARGVIVTILVTPRNGDRIKTAVQHSDVRLFHLKFPYAEAGLPEGCESTELLPSPGHLRNLYAAIDMLSVQVEELIPGLDPKPTCLMADIFISWATGLARKLRLPRLVFHTSCCLCLVRPNMLEVYPETDIIPSSEADYFVLPRKFPPQFVKVIEEMYESEREAFGTVANTFEELEPECVEKYTKIRDKKLWCIGPLSLYNKDDSYNAERGNEASIDQHQCLKWLDSHESSSVIYACLGSEAQLSTPQLIELGLGLERSNQPFIWVVRNASDEFKKWLHMDSGGEFEQRIKGRGLVIQGWAPQVLILSHRSIGGFITHCGWNSTLEGITAGLPMITWPLASEQFLNEKLIVNVIKIGIRVGGEENGDVQVKSEDVKMAIDKLMDGGEEGRERREKVRMLAGKAKGAVEEGGSSYNNMAELIEEVVIMQQAMQEH